MANTDSVRGFKLVGTLHGKAPRIRTYFIPAADATAVFLGDAVKSAGSADSDGFHATVAQAAATDILRGVVVGVDQIRGVAATSQVLYRNHRPASTAMYVEVCDDPDAIYEIQEDGVGA